MPQGTVIAIRPIGLHEEEFKEIIESHLKENDRQKLLIGELDVCDTQGESGVNLGDKLPFLINENHLPPNLKKGSCSISDATKFNFKVGRVPFKFGYDLKKVERQLPSNNHS